MRERGWILEMRKKRRTLQKETRCVKTNIKKASFKKMHLYNNVVNVIIHNYKTLPAAHTPQTEQN